MTSLHASALDPRIRIRAPLRCDGIGSLDWAEDRTSGDRLAVRWVPTEANGLAAALACERLPAHPLLPRVVQTGHVGSLTFMAMDFPEGELLSARLEGGAAMDPVLVLRLGARLASALAAVHAQGLVHGELSLDSVLLAGGERAFLWDLPLVVANRHSDRRGEHGLMLALLKTAAFLAPERARGEPASAPGDVFALGAILCAAAGGGAPATGGVLGVLHDVASGRWAPSAPAGLPEPWRAVVQRMLAREPVARPTSAWVAEALADVPRDDSPGRVPAAWQAEPPALPLEPAPGVQVLPEEVMQVISREIVSLELLDPTPPPPAPARPPMLPVPVPPPLPQLRMAPPGAGPGSARGVTALRLADDAAATAITAIMPAVSAEAAAAAAARPATARAITATVRVHRPRPVAGWRSGSWWLTVVAGAAALAVVAALGSYLALTALFPEVNLLESAGLQGARP